MQNPIYLSLSRHNVYYFRFPIPRWLHPRLRPSHVRISLKTREPNVALQMAKVLSHLAELLIARMSARHMRYDEIRTVLKQHFIEMLEKRKRVIAEQGRLGELDKTALKNSIDFAGHGIEHGESLIPFRKDKEVLGPFMDRHGLV
ncbi:MAG: DUF6538 domain-containing protein, partial [Hyphomicrobiales bacterium]